MYSAIIISYVLSLSLSPSRSLTRLLIEQITERDKFMSPKEAQEFGIIDHVLTHTPKQTDSETTTN